MVIGFSGLGGAFSDAMLKAYLWKLQRDLGQRDLAEAEEREFRRHTFIRDLDRPERERREAQEERRQTREAALQRIAALKQTYSIQQIINTPQLRDAYMRDYEVAYGQPFPSREVPETSPVTRQGFLTVPKTAPTAMELFRAGERGQPFVPKVFPTTEQVQIPTGKMVREPILPQGSEIIVDVPGVGRIPLSQLPEGAQSSVITRLFDQGSKVDIRLDNGQVIKGVSPDKAAEIASRPGQPQVSMVTFKDPQSGATVTVPATAIPSFFPRKAPGEEKVSSEGLTPDQKRVVDAYNKLVDQRTRLLDIISTSLDEGAKARAQQDIAGLDQRIKQLQPQVDRIQGLRGSQPSPTGGTLSAEAIGYIKQAAASRVPLDQVLAWAAQNGLDANAVRSVYSQVPGGAPPPTGQQPTLAGMSTFVNDLKQRGRVWSQARVLIINELVKRGYSPAEAARLADTQGKQLWNQPSTVPKGDAGQVPRIGELVDRYAKQFQIPLEIARRLVQAESGGRPSARSPKGAVGVMQLMPGTARELGVTNAFDPEQNIKAGMRYLRQMYDRFKSWRLALAAYNAGPGAVEKHGGVPPFKKTQDYIRRILDGIS